MDEQSRYAWEQMHSQEHIFLTGNAGTGKTTLIRKFIDANKSKCIVLAPTGIAAVNAQGQTVHSFCHFPARPVGYNNIKTLSRDVPDELEKIMIIESAQYLIIDEVSMLRADLMDQISWFFKKNTNKIFGGLKLIMVGDLDQLPPVVSSDAEREMISQRYQNEFFYSANCWRETPVKVAKLSKVYRQTDPIFLDLLNAIKTNNNAQDAISKINELCLVRDRITPSDGILICTTNKQVDIINAEMMERLPGAFISIKGEVKGDFDLKNCLVEETLNLKINCRVMIVRNGEGYQNGSLGTLIKTHKDYLSIALDSGQVVEVGKYKFESTAFKYDKEKDAIKHNITGQFMQFPVRVAYAITIHKAQGQTFDKVIIDVGERGAFAHGQVYVALSRCRTLEGLKLIRPLKVTDLHYNKSILEFNKAF